MNIPWHKVPRTKKYKAFKALAVVNLTLLVVNLFAFVFIVQPRETPSLAQKEELLCLRVCPNGSPTCNFGTCAILPSVTTDGVSSITQSTAIASGTVISDGGHTIIERGFVLSTGFDPTILDNKYSVAGTTGSFNYSLTDLAASTAYYIRAYASNTVALVYGTSVLFTTLAPGEEPIEEEEPEEGGGGLPPPPFLTYEQLQEYLIPNPPVDDRIIVEIAHIVDVDGTRTPITPDTEPIKLRGLFNVFRGTTNIKDAIVVLSITSKVYHGSVAADKFGHFSWQLPEALEPGLHVLTVQAFSPYNAGLNTISQYIIDITYPDVDIEPSPVMPLDIIDAIPPSPAVLPPQPPITRLGDIYILNTSVVEPEGGLTQTSQIEAKTVIESLDPDIIETFTLTFRLFDNNGARLYLASKDISVKGKLIDISRLVTSFELVPDNYLLAVELKRGELRYVATHVFTIQAPIFAITPALSVPVARVQGGLLVSAFILYLLLLFLIYLMYREYKRAKLALHHITGKDLLEKGMIS